MATTDDKKIIFSMVGVSKIIPQNRKQILKDIYLSFFYGAKIGIIGLNGAGKSTLMKIIAGLEQPSQGEVVWSPGYSVGYLPQDPPLNEEKTVKENVMEGVQKAYDALQEYEEINQKFGLEEYYGDPDKMDKLMQRQAEVQDIIDATDAWNMDSKLDRAMAALRCPASDLPVTHLSGGERRRVALCRLLLQKPDVLLLDEPTNHLDAESIDWLEQHLQQYEGTVIAVTHDRYFLDKVANCTLELENGKLTEYLGNYSYYLMKKEIAEEEAREEREALEAAEREQQAKAKHEAEARRKAAAQEEKTDDEVKKAAERRAEEKKRAELGRIQSMSDAKREEMVQRAEAEIAMAEAELKGLEFQMNNPTVQADPQQSQAIAEAYAAKEKEIEMRYEKWERLTEA